MEKMNKDGLIEQLLLRNPKAKMADVCMYADSFMDYQNAQKNITENGAIVLHPRTNSPIENPYIKIRDKSAVFMRRIRMNADFLWQEFSEK